MKKILKISIKNALLSLVKKNKKNIIFNFEFLFIYYSFYLFKDYIFNIHICNYIEECIYFKY